MYDKWNLNRNPFHLRPVDFTNNSDFYCHGGGLATTSGCQEGICVITGESGIGKTSLANFCRFNQPSSYTVKFEFLIDEHLSLTSILEEIIYIIATDLFEHKTAATKKILIEYNNNRGIIDLKSFVEGINQAKHKKKSSKNYVASLQKSFSCLISAITKQKQFKVSSLQFTIADPIENERTIELLDSLYEVFSVPKMVWYLCIDPFFESSLKNKSTIASIVTQWISVSPITPDELYKLFLKRIANSGNNAINPLTKDAIQYLAEYTLGRTRLALDIAGRLINRYADDPYIKVITQDLVEQFVVEEIKNIVNLDQLTPTSLKLLRIIKDNSGKNSSEISSLSSVPAGNLMKFINPLIEQQLVRSVKQGRQTFHYPRGLGEVL